MTNEELVAEIKAGINEKENLTALWEQNKRFVAKMAQRYKGYAEFDDLMQEGYIALHDAVEKYDTEKGMLFLTFAGQFIKRAMIRLIRGQDAIRISPHEMELIGKYNMAVNEIKSRTGREPTRAEIRASIGASDKVVDMIEKSIILRNIASTESAICSDTGDDITLMETIADDNNCIEEAEDRIYHRELKETIWKTVDSLPEDQCHVIHEKYENGKTSMEIGEESGISVNKVFSLENNALRSMRMGRHSIELRRFLDVQIYSSAVQQCGVGVFNRTNTSSTERVALNMM